MMRSNRKLMFAVALAAALLAAGCGRKKPSGDSKPDSASEAASRTESASSAESGVSTLEDAVIWNDSGAESEEDVLIWNDSEADAVIRESDVDSQDDAVVWNDSNAESSSSESSSAGGGQDGDVIVDDGSQGNPGGAARDEQRNEQFGGGTDEQIGREEANAARTPDEQAAGDENENHVFDASGMAPGAEAAVTPTAAPRPTTTPRPTAVPRPTTTPRPTVTPKPTATPRPTTAPQPASSPESEEEDVIIRDAESDGQQVDSTVEPAEAAAGPEQEPLLDHVRGIRAFSMISGMRPDVMAGISWDETIEKVEPDINGIDWDEEGKHQLRYLITAADGRQELAEIEVTINPDLDLYVYGMEGDAVVKVGGSFDPMAGITHGNEIASINADASGLDTSRAGVYLVSYILTAPDGRTQSTVRQVTVSDGTYAGFEDNTAEAFGSFSTVTDLGLWRLTAYMDTPQDQGPYVGQTASGAPLVAGRTVAVSAATCARLGLQFGDHLMIDGHIYVLEDHGGSAMNDQNWVDIFVDNPVDEFSDMFNRYSEVYLLR